MLSRPMLDFTLGDILPFPYNIKIAAFRSLGERFTRGRLCNYRVYCLHPLKSEHAGPPSHRTQPLKIEIDVDLKLPPLGSIRGGTDIFDIQTEGPALALVFHSISTLHPRIVQQIIEYRSVEIQRFDLLFPSIDIEALGNIPGVTVTDPKRIVSTVLYGE